MLREVRPDARLACSGWRSCWPTARVIRTGGKNVKDVAGYALTHLFVGSQGTLGIITEATLRLRVAPPPRSTLLAFFPTLDGGRRRRSPGSSRPGSPGDARADGPARRSAPSTSVHSWGSTASRGDAPGRERPAGRGRRRGARRAPSRRATAAGATSTVRAADATEADWLRQARRLALRALERLGDGPDGGRRRAPRPRAGPARRDRARSPRSTASAIATFGHAGDGNLHPNFIFDRDDPRAEELTEIVRADLTAAAIALGGTVTARARDRHCRGARRSSSRSGADVVGVMRSIKAALDPQGILNPGRVFRDADRPPAAATETPRRFIRTARVLRIYQPNARRVESRRPRIEPIRTLPWRTRGRPSRPQDPRKDRSDHAQKARLTTAGAAIVVLTIGAAPFLANAADHLDAPGLGGDFVDGQIAPHSEHGDRDINDVYVFTAPDNAGRTVHRDDRQPGHQPVRRQLRRRTSATHQRRQRTATTSPTSPTSPGSATRTSTGNQQYRITKYTGSRTPCRSSGGTTVARARRMRNAKTGGRAVGLGRRSLRPVLLRPDRVHRHDDAADDRHGRRR